MAEAKKPKDRKSLNFPADARAPIRAAYEKTLTATARLATFAAYNSDYASPIDDKLAELAIDDLLTLAISGRRLIETAKARHCIASVKIPNWRKNECEPLPLARVLDKVIHHRKLNLIRRRSDLMVVELTAEGLNQYLTAARDHLPPTFIVRSDKDGVIVFRAAEIAGAFLNSVIKSVEDHCEEHNLWLDDALLRDD